MKKTFCIAGPIWPEKHYHLPFRMNEADLMQLIDEGKYFILHAPRQSGKTTAMRWLVDQLNASGGYEALYVNVEPAQAAREDYVRANKMILRVLEDATKKVFGKQHQAYAFFSPEHAGQVPAGMEISSFLRYWTEEALKPTIFFIDEIDALMGDTLISVLRQLRAGYTDRPAHFPQSVCLIGLRDVRDYRIHSKIENEIITGGSAFNIKAESLTIDNFLLAEVRALYQQHTAATGQQFTDEAIVYAFEQTQGQPWLVNALAYQACFRAVLDRSQPITLEVMQRSCETLILRRDTHLDQLLDKLTESRVLPIIDAIIAGKTEAQMFPADDLRYVRDLGMIDKKSMAIANPIYQEVFPRELIYSTQETMTFKPPAYLTTDRSLNMHKLLTDWIAFYRENSGMWREQFKFKESGPHLLLMAYVQRVVNGGGTVLREYALGSGRVDLTIAFGKQRILIEIKIRRSSSTLSQGLEQTAEYMDVMSATEGHLVVFDQREKISWPKKIFQRDEVVGSKTIHVWGM